MQKLEEDYNLFDWWKKVVFKNYANFNGRARRKEYWNFTLANIIFLFALYIPLVIGLSIDVEWLTLITALPLILFIFGIIIPWIAVAVRRLHDTNKSGWMLLLRIVPVLSIIIFVFLVIEGDKRKNDYGKDPKAPMENELDQIGLE
jgi:uncharacterized membrane protein YhaH (DUF805 family)